VIFVIKEAMTRWIGDDAGTEVMASVF